MEINLIISDSWLDDDFKSIGEILNETVNEFVGDNDEVVNIQIKTEESGLSRFWIYVASRDSRQLSAVPSDGELWSAIRTLMDQGAMIHLDYTNKEFEEYSARMDAAARERVDWLKEFLKRGIADNARRLHARNRGRVDEY